MAANSWLPLTEYSSKYKVSISTLRRRLRANRTEYKYEEGKYLLKDSPLVEHNPNNQSEGRTVSAPPQSLESVSTSDLFIAPVAEARDVEEISPVLATSHKLLSELKKAYMLVLQEKEEQVMILRDEVADLQTLVRVLEEENSRLKQAAKSVEPKANMGIEQNWLHDLELE